MVKWIWCGKDVEITFIRLTDARAASTERSGILPELEMALSARYRSVIVVLALIKRSAYTHFAMGLVVARNLSSYHAVSPNYTTPDLAINITGNAQLASPAG